MKKNSLLNQREENMRSMFLICCLALLLPLVISVQAEIPFNSGAFVDTKASASSFDMRPLVFIENQGQWDDQVLFKAVSGGASMWFTYDGVYHQFTKRIDQQEQNSDILNDLYQNIQREEQYSYEQIVLKSSLIGANFNPEIAGTDRMEYKCNYFFGNDQSKWRTNVPNYRAVIIDEVYSGIDLKYYSNEQGRLEYDFIVEPGTDPSVIQVQYDGAKSLAINTAGELVIETKWHSFTQLKPVIYQYKDGNKESIEGDYILLSDNTFGFELGNDYNQALALVIDPVLVFSTYIGGSGDEEASEIELDQDGNIIVCGQVRSSDFPMQNPFDGTYEGNDIFITKFNPEGTALIFSTYFGSTGSDYPYTLHIDSDNNIYFAGTTYFESDFPLVNAYDSILEGNSDAYLSKLSSSGDNLIFSTFLGGDDNETISSICTDDNSYVYVTGKTYSSDFPTYQAYDYNISGTSDAFVTKFYPAGNSLSYSTFLGGSSTDGGGSIAVDVNGCAYVIGSTRSTNFPTLNAYDDTQNGNNDIFVAKFSTAGNSLVYSTYLGGDENEGARCIELDDNNSVYFCGYSGSANYPTKNAYDDTNDNPGAYTSDIIISVLGSDGDSLIYSTFFGSPGTESATEMALGVDGKFYLTGSTSSTEFPTVNPIYPTFMGGVDDAWVSVLSAAGDELLFSTFLGGTGHDLCVGIDVDSEDQVYLVGTTTSFDFPTVNAYDDSHNGGGMEWELDVFVTSMRLFEPVYVDSVFPHQNAFDVSRTADISITFTASMDPASFDLTNHGISVYGSQSGWHEFTSSYDDPSFTLTLDPDESFRVGEMVTVCVKDNAQSTEGVNLPYDYHWQFYVEALNGSYRYVPYFFEELWVSVSSVAIADFDNDSLLDFAVSADMSNRLFVYLNSISGFGPFTTPIDISTPSHVIAVQNDDYHDLYAISYDHNEFAEYRNDGSGDFDNTYTYSLSSSSLQIANYPVKGTDDLMFVTTDYSQNRVRLFELDSTTGITSSSYRMVGNTPFGIIYADLDMDGNLDVITANSATDSITVLWGEGLGTGNYLMNRTDFYVGTNSGPIDLVAADFDGDMQCDIATANWSSQSLSILINSGGRSFDAPVAYSLAHPYPNSICTFDIDADGYLDLTLTYDGSTSVAMAINDGDGTFTFTTPVYSGTLPYDMMAADFNNDGAIDLAFASSLSEDVSVIRHLKYDEDSDGIPTVVDNCPLIANPEQEDADGDDIGDVCDDCTDTDDDTYGNPNYAENTCPPDNCPTIFNDDQIDSDFDGVGDACTYEEITTIGVDVSVDLGGYVTVEFDEITGDGSTELEITTTGPGTTGFTIVPEIPPVYYNVTTTATFTGEILVCLPYDDTEMTLEEEQALTIQHYDNGTWVNITYSVDTDANIICGLSDSLSPFVMAVLTYICGDANSDEVINVSDAVWIINYVFVGGDPPDPIESGDCNCDDTCNVSDAVWIINYVFVGGNDPCDSDGDDIPDC
jgi:FG-GAP-like repeat/Bacterial Ig-like domain/Dockerin type I domain/Beta-propeller repeat